ncbi:MAG: SIS domain-containing protein [Anaerolineae bacterium]|nr:SIS domain-containing protein [Anaerolineae bacterium]
MNLDDLPRFKALDPQDMIGHINAMPDHIERTWSRAQALPLPNRFAQADKVVICGMGGSAIGGELVAFALADQSRAPIMVNRGYDLPAFATGEDTLVVACSHSGDTEETLAAFAQAGARGAQRMAICTGGALRAQADEAGVVTWTYDYASQPRAALGFSLTLLLALAHRLGLARDLDAAVAEAVAVMRGQTAQYRPETPTGANPAKQLAAALFGRIPRRVRRGDTDAGGAPLEDPVQREQQALGALRGDAGAGSQCGRGHQPAGRPAGEGRRGDAALPPSIRRASRSALRRRGTCSSSGTWTSRLRRSAGRARAGWRRCFRRCAAATM